MLKFVVGLMFCLAAADAQARASGIAQGGWSNLSTEQMSRFPAAVRLALKDAQNLCGGETTRVRTGFLRYLPGSEGQEFAAIHFEHFDCSGKDLLCSTSGCLHRLFITTSGRMREIWRGNIREIDMSNENGIPSIDFDCGRGGSFCHFRRKWNGTRLQ